MVLNKEQYMEVVKKIVGDETSDDSLKMLEDLTDTYNSFSNSPSNEWEDKYKELETKHSDLTKRYKERFFAPSKEEPIEEPITEPVEDINPDAGTSYDDLLKGE